MSKTIAEMTIAEIERVLRQRRALKKKAPKPKKDDEPNDEVPDYPDDMPEAVKDVCDDIFG